MTREQELKTSDSRRSFLKRVAGSALFGAAGLSFASKDATASRETMIRIQEADGKRVHYEISLKTESPRMSRRENNDRVNVLNGRSVIEGYLWGGEDRIFVPAGTEIDYLEVAGRGELAATINGGLTKRSLDRGVIMDTIREPSSYSQIGYVFKTTGGCSGLWNDLADSDQFGRYATGGLETESGSDAYLINGQAKYIEYRGQPGGKMRFNVCPEGQLL